jgi:colanic acid/amylovoran biosynthesis glycosyltransferase
LQSHAGADVRVLHLWDNYAPGLFDHSFEICREEGVAAALVCMNWIDRGSPAPADMHFVRKVPIDAAPSTLLGRVVDKPRSWIDQRRFRALVERRVREFRPDVLHIHYGTTGAILASSPAIERLPFVISFYGFDISQGLGIERIRSAYRRLFMRRPLVHVLCAEAAERAVALGADPLRIVDANLPLPVELYPDVGVEDPVRHWLIPARFVEKKGHRVLLDAFKLHLRDFPDARLTCWGYGDSRWLEAAIAELGLTNRVTVIDNRGSGDFDALYLEQLRRHDAIVTPSVRSSSGDDEGGPALTTVLAQVAGKPVIVSNFPGHERSVTNGIEGLVVPENVPVALANAMGKLAADEALARRMGAVGRAGAVREFDHNAFRDALLGWYKRLAAGR